MTRKANKTADELPAGPIPRAPSTGTWLSEILSSPDAIPQSAWNALQPPRPKSATEKRALEREIGIGGQTVTIYEVRKQLLIELIESKALKLLLAIDETERMEKATVQQLAVAFGVLVDKARLLKGEPTAIYRHEDVRKLDELGAAIMSEMKRRGIAIDSTAELEEEAI